MKFGGNRMQGYFAAPLFNEAERRFNRFVVRRIERYANVFLPQRDGGLLLEMIKQGVLPSDAERAVFQYDISAMQNADFLVAVLDGSGVDEGVAFEIGYMHCLGQPCFGFQTDVRRALPTGNNPMLVGALHEMFTELSALEAALKSLVSELDARLRLRHTRNYSTRKISAGT